MNKIKNKETLKWALRDENYDRIAIWADGEWSNVGTSYAGEQDGDNPAAYIQRSFWYDLTWKEITVLIAEKEAEINTL